MKFNILTFISQTQETCTNNRYDSQAQEWAACGDADEDLAKHDNITDDRILLNFRGKRLKH